MARKQKQANNADIDQKLERMRQQLEALEERVERTYFASDQEEQYGEVTTVDQHPADYGSETLDRELGLTVREILESEEREVTEAIAKRRSGTYGICEECGRPIDPERLRARPHAVTCIDCQRHREELMRRTSLPEAPA